MENNAKFLTETALRIKRDFVPVYKDRDAWLAAWAELME